MTSILFSVFETFLESLLVMTFARSVGMLFEQQFVFSQLLGTALIFQAIKLLHSMPHNQER